MGGVPAPRVFTVSKRNTFLQDQRRPNVSYRAERYSRFFARIRRLAHPPRRQITAVENAEKRSIQIWLGAHPRVGALKIFARRARRNGGALRPLRAFRRLRRIIVREAAVKSRGVTWSANGERRCGSFARATGRA